jgi:hypothetical protein
MSADWPDLTIGEIARCAGVATSAIRYYERVGLLPEAERVSGQRRYGEDAVGRLAFIARAAIERAEAMRAWLEVASGCECASTEECALFPQPEDAASALPLHVTSGWDCRRAAAN